MAATKHDALLLPPSEDIFLNELILSLPESERAGVLEELEHDAVVQRTKRLVDELATGVINEFEIPESRTLFLAALRGVKLKQISAAELATLHIFDSAIRTLYISPRVYLRYYFLNADKGITNSVYHFPIPNDQELPNRITHLHYNTIICPNYNNLSISDLPWRMQKPLVYRFFSFTEAEWTIFCEIMENSPPLERTYRVAHAPESGCWSDLIANIQKVLKCMRTLDRYAVSTAGLHFENVMVIPSFTMFQAALNAKAQTLKRIPVQLIPTYGIINLDHYAELKTQGKIALTLYLPEKDSELRYKEDRGSFRSTIDGHPYETAFAGAIHDVYHAMREMAMSERVAKARMRLAQIALSHPKNKINEDHRSIYEILVDGELIYSYPPEVDTMFEPDYRAPTAESFGRIFTTASMAGALHPELKRLFIQDMVQNKSFWHELFDLGRADLLDEDKLIYDDIQRHLNAKRLKFSPSRAISNLGFLSVHRRRIEEKTCPAASQPSLHMD
ncbi:hypothetical protein [Legionella worsleiensis]|uniref:Uncharacterized protein n=1 Tax=Legionella worsleiensis TaxID=45076 RepID=A0A0W1A5R2_9GAMM|nr:hypothetical protein [Legionella worsleiensis]KTD76686.1 hypothetical protein Lwor_1911 [Legionella worsleiensis]STY30441.1 Uncharacterised protein [Legionella worsleiensis]